MAKTELTFQFDYSEDGGGTWKETVPVTFKVRNWDVKLPNELLVEHILDENNEIVRYFAPRVRLRLVLDVINFDSTVDSTHASYVWMQKWLARAGTAILRISHDTGETLDGINYWASSTNTYYVVPQPEQEADKINADWRKLDIVLELAETITI
jgi:hypothetical protein